MLSVSNHSVIGPSTVGIARVSQFAGNAWLTSRKTFLIPPYLCTKRTTLGFAPRATPPWHARIVIKTGTRSTSVTTASAMAFCSRDGRSFAITSNGRLDGLCYFWRAYACFC